MHLLTFLETEILGCIAASKDGKIYADDIVKLWDSSKCTVADIHDAIQALHSVGLIESSDNAVSWSLAYLMEKPKASVTTNDDTCAVSSDVNSIVDLLDRPRTREFLAHNFPKSKSFDFYIAFAWLVKHDMVTFSPSSQQWRLVKNPRFYNFERQLRELINRCSIETENNTPDYVLANYLGECLNAFTTAIKARDRANNRDVFVELAARQSELQE